MKKFLIRRLKTEIAKHIRLKHNLITNRRGKITLFVWVELLRWDIRKNLSVELDTGRITEINN